MVNRREKEVAERYKEKGWEPIRGGWPDWLMVRTEGYEEYEMPLNDQHDTRYERISDVKVVEVKSPQGRLRLNQMLARKALEEHLGADYEIEVVK